MHIVITGSTRGLGLALARRFLQEGDHVMICSRTSQRVEQVVEKLREKFPDQVIGHTVDVTDYTSVEKLASTALDHWSRIDVWINNAGTKGNETALLTEVPVNQINTVITTNVIGTLYGCRVAIQYGCSHIFNVDGLGSQGRVQSGLLLYGTSKRTIPYISKALAEELKISDSSTHVHTISPGMVLTDLLLENASSSSRRVFNILAELPSTVADKLVPQMRALVPTEKSGQYIKFLSNWRIMWRFLTFWRYKNRFFDDEGNLLVDLV